MPYKPSENWNDARRDLQCGGIYIIKNLINQDCYVGQACNIWDRIRRHAQKMRDGKHENQHLQRAWVKYGAESFTFDVLCFCYEDNSKQVLDDYENFFISFYAQHGKLFPAYNNRPDAISNRGLSSPMKGKTFSDEVRANMREGQKNRTPWVFSEEELEKKRQKWLTDHPLKNPETVRKLVETRHANGSYHTDAAKAHMKELSAKKEIPVQSIDPATGIVKIYCSAVVAARENGVTHGRIGRVCKSDTDTCAGLLWAFADQDPKLVLEKYNSKIANRLKERVMAKENPDRIKKNDVCKPKPVDRVDPKTGDVVSYSSATEAVLCSGGKLQAGGISKTVLGRRASYAGFKWRYSTTNE